MQPLSHETTEFFGETGLERMSERRTDKDWLRSVTESAAAVVLPIWQTRNLIVQQGDTPEAVRVSLTVNTAMFNPSLMICRSLPRLQRITPNNG